MRKIRTIASVIIVLVAVCVLATACGRFTDYVPTIGEIYGNTYTAGAIDTATLQTILPEGWSVLGSAASPNADSDTGYIASLDAYVVKNSDNVISIVKANGGEGQLLFGAEIGVKAVHAVGDTILFRRTNSGREEYGAMNSNGNFVLDPALTSNSATATLTSALRVLDDNLIAVNPSYDNGTTNKNYTPIYSTETGELVCRVKNPNGSLLNMYAFDGRYVVTSFTDGSKNMGCYIYDLQRDGAAGGDVDPSSYGIYYNADGSLDNYYVEALYIGNGRFYVHQEWTVDSDEEYTYFYNDEYAKVVRYIYDAAANKRDLYESPYIFINLVSPRYANGTDYMQIELPDSAPTGYSYYSNGIYYDSTAKCFKVAADTFLQEGYFMSFFALYVPENKEAEYDQLVLNEDLKVVYSLTGNAGIKVEGTQEKESIGYYDLIMRCADDLCYTPICPSALRVYTRDGKLVFEKTDRNFLSVSYQDGMFVAATVDAEGNVLYGAYDKEGNLAVDFKYTYIEPFRGYYTYAVSEETGSNVLLGRNGKTVDVLQDGTTPFADAAKSSNKPILKRGCYMYKTTVDSTTLYGIKVYGASGENDIVIPAEYSSSATLYTQYVDSDVCHFYGIKQGDGRMFVYKLTGAYATPASDANGLTAGEIAGITIGCAAFAAIVVTASVLIAKKKKSSPDSGADK